MAVPTEALPGERRGGWDLPEPVAVQVGPSIDETQGMALGICMRTCQLS